MRVRSAATLVAFVLLISGIACTERSAHPDVQGQVERELEAAGLRDVEADQDRDRGVVTLTGEVSSEDEKVRAEEIARATAGGQVVANEIAVRPPGMEGQAGEAQSALDSAIEDNFKATLVSNQLDDDITYESNEGVLTLKGEVATAQERQRLEQLASQIPNVRQVVNTIEINPDRAATGQPAATERAPANR